MKVLISGTSGFIGGNLFNILGKSFFAVSIGRSLNSNIVADFGDLDSIITLNLKGFDLFIYCSGATDEEFEKDALKAYQRSTYYFSKLLEKVINQGIKKIIHFSAGQVYGTFEGHIDENSPVNPITDYSIAHYAAEQILRRFSEQFDIQVLVIRPGAVFGTPQNWDTFKRWHLIPYSFPLSCIYKQKIVLRSSGFQKRDFVSIKDVAGYITSYLECPKYFDRYSILNPTGNNALSVYDFAVKCKTIYTKLTGNKCEVIRTDVVNNRMSNHFEYCTKYNFYKPIHGLDEYLEIFMKKVLKDYEINIFYGINLNE